jgi:hypothetical protein
MYFLCVVGVRCLVCSWSPTLIGVPPVLTQIPNALAFVLREYLLRRQDLEEASEEEGSMHTTKKCCHCPSSTNGHSFLGEHSPYKVQNYDDDGDEQGSCGGDNSGNDHIAAVDPEGEKVGSYSKDKIYRIIAMATTISIIRSILALVIGVVIILFSKVELNHFKSCFQALILSSSWNIEERGGGNEWKRSLGQAAGLATVCSTLVYVFTKLSSLAVAGGEGGAFRATLASSLSLPLSILVFTFMGENATLGLVGVLGLVQCSVGLYVYVFASSTRYHQDLSDGNGSFVDGNFSWCLRWDRKPPRVVIHKDNSEKLLKNEPSMS